MRKMETIKLSLIKPDPKQPRQEFDPADLLQLKKSIASHGILRPLMVEKNGKGTYLLIDGERRYKSAHQLGLKEVPVEIYESMTELERFIKRFHVQSQHKDWSYFDKARAIKYMVDLGSLNPKEVGEVLGIPLNRVSDFLSLLQLSKRSQELVEKKRLKFDYLVKLNRLLRVIEPSLKSKTEQAILDRIEAGTLVRAKDILDYGFAVRKAGSKITKLIIADKDYTASQALKDSKAGTVLSYHNLIQYCGWLNLRISDAVKNGAGKELDEPGLKIINKTIEKLQSFKKS